MQIEIKERPIKNGNRSLYLEYYENGFRKKVSLNLYLIPDDAPNAKRINEHVYKLAQEIRSEKILHPGSLEEKKPTDECCNKKITWLEWCDEYIQYSISCKNCKKMLDQKKGVRKRIAEFLELNKTPKLLLKDVNKKILKGLFSYMRDTYRNKQQIKANDGKLADFTLLLFEETIKAMLNKAIRDGLLNSNPIKDLNRAERFHAPDKHREFLTAEELHKFLEVQTESTNEELVRRAFGFSSMTGLRLGDIQRLRWSNIMTSGDTKMVSVVQQKTRRAVSVPLNEVALSMLPARPKDGSDCLVFPLPKKADNVAKYVRRIKDKAGIEKDITFHCSRHTAATLAITAGAELYTVSKILGHGSIASTQVYAKVDMKKKFEAVNLTDGIFD